MTAFVHRNDTRNPFWVSQPFGGSHWNAVRSTKPPHHSCVSLRVHPNACCTLAAALHSHFDMPSPQTPCLHTQPPGMPAPHVRLAQALTRAVDVPVLYCCQPAAAKQHPKAKRATPFAQDRRGNVKRITYIVAPSCFEHGLIAWKTIHDHVPCNVELRRTMFAECHG